MDARIGRTALDALTAALVLAAGVIHFLIWRSTYRHIPSQVPGVWVVKTGFPIDAAVSIVVVIAIIVLVRRLPLLLLAVAAFQAVDIAFLVLSREASIFGWKESGWNSDAKQVIVVEILAFVSALAAFALHSRGRRELVVAH